jgi:hypothetical protein
MAQRTEKIHEVPIQQIDVHTDTREILANARQQAEERNYQDYVIFDVDAHHIETVHWGEICEYIEDPVIRSQAVTSQKANPYGLIGDRGMTYQDVGGRIPHDTEGIKREGKQ